MTLYCEGSRFRFSISPMLVNYRVLGCRMASFSLKGGAGLGMKILLGSWLKESGLLLM